MAKNVNDALKAVRGIDYGVEQAFGLYPTSGARDDYAFGRYFADLSKAKVYGFTIECGQSFQPAWSEAEEVIREVSSGLIGLCLEASSSAPIPIVASEGTDIVLVRQTAGWNTIPIAFSNEDGGWRITNGGAPDFIANWASQPGVRLVTGDFKDHKYRDTFIAPLPGGSEAKPIARSCCRLTTGKVCRLTLRKVCHER